MGKRLPATRPPAPRVIHYVDPSTPAELAYPMHPAQLAAQQRRQQVAYLRWKARQEAIAARDHKVRRFWLGFGAVVGLVVLVGLALTGWLLWTAVGLGVLAVPALALIVTAVAVGGHLFLRGCFGPTAASCSGTRLDRLAICFGPTCG